MSRYKITFIEKNFKRPEVRAIEFLQADIIRNTGTGAVLKEVISCFWVYNCSRQRQTHPTQGLTYDYQPLNSNSYLLWFAVAVDSCQVKYTGTDRLGGAEKSLVEEERVKEQKRSSKLAQNAGFEYLGVRVPEKRNLTH